MNNHKLPKPDDSVYTAEMEGNPWTTSRELKD